MPPWLKALFSGTGERWRFRRAHWQGWLMGRGRSAVAEAGARAHAGSSAGRPDLCSALAVRASVAADFSLSIDMVALLVNLLISVLVPSLVGKVG